MFDNTRRIELMGAIEAELEHAYAKHGSIPWSRHEFFAILKEECDELWDAIRADDEDRYLLQELTQVAAMCFRYLETGNRDGSNHPGVPIRRT